MLCQTPAHNNDATTITVLHQRKTVLFNYKGPIEDLVALSDQQTKRDPDEIRQLQQAHFLTITDFCEINTELLTHPRPTLLGTNGVFSLADRADMFAAGFRRRRSRASEDDLMQAFVRDFPEDCGYKRESKSTAQAP